MATAWVFACDNPQPPVPCGSVPEQTITVGESATVTLCFNDPNGPWLEMLQVAILDGDIEGALDLGQERFTQIMEG